jgi:membrane protein
VSVINPLNWLRAAWTFVFDVAKRWYFGGIGDLAAGVTFWILLSLPAVILAMVSALGVLDSLLGRSLSAEIEEDITGFVERVFTSEAPGIANAVDELFAQQELGLLTVSVALTLWTISRGFAGMIRALDGVYEVDDARAWYYTRIVALVLGLGSLLVSVPIVLLELFVWSRFPDGAIESILRSGVAVVILVFWASMIFHYGPSIRTKWRWDLPGSIVAAVFWWLLTVGYQSYIDVVSGRNGVLSVIGASLLALTWVWLAAQVLLIGAAVNVQVATLTGIERSRREWKIPEVLRTGEMKKITAEALPPRRPADPDRLTEVWGGGTDNR